MIDFSGRLQGHAAPIPVASVVVLDYFMPCLCLVSSVFAILFMAVLFLDQPKNRTKANAILGAPSFYSCKSVIRHVGLSRTSKPKRRAKIRR